MNISERIEEAKIAVSKKKCFFYPDLTNSVMELMDLEIDTTDEIWVLIRELLDELEPKHYIKTDLKGFKALSPLSEFLTFLWDSVRLKRRVKFTFVLNEGYFYYFSLC